MGTPTAVLKNRRKNNLSLVPEYLSKRLNFLIKFLLLKVALANELIYPVNKTTATAVLKNRRKSNLSLVPEYLSKRLNFLIKFLLLKVALANELICPVNKTTPTAVLKNRRNSSRSYEKQVVISFYQDASLN